MGIALLLRALSKFGPLLEEIILNDKTLLEYIKSNKYHLFLLAIVITLSISLLNARKRAYVIEFNPPISQSSTIVDRAVENAMVLIPNRPIDPNGPPRAIEDNAVLPRKELQLRKLIKDRLLEQDHE